MDVLVSAEGFSVPMGMKIQVPGQNPSVQMPMQMQVILHDSSVASSYYPILRQVG